MERKKIILIAVLVNAGLLAVLFIAALTSQEESPRPLDKEVADLPQAEPQPLFPDSASLSLQTPPQMQLPLSTGESAPVLEEPIVHKLPPLVPEAISPPTPVEIRSEPSFTEVVVKKGDTLEKIAKVNQTTVGEIIKLNHLASSFLRMGQVLKMPKEKKVPLSAPISSVEYYVVKVGDNPWTIAMKHHMKVEELLKLNHLNEEKARKLKPGDRLRVR